MKVRGTIYTIGHSTLELDKFIADLAANSVELVADVRTVPRSRHNPQFNVDNLPGALRLSGIGYRHMPALGGLRHARRDSPNTAWLNASFRGFADYMQTAEFDRCIEELIETALSRRTAIMCAEALPWRCHRSLIADALVVRGFAVEHIIGGRPHGHRITSWARVDGFRITYPGEKSRPK